MKGMLLFTEVANALKKIRSQFIGRTLNLRGTSLDLSDIEEMLKHETSDFEVGFPLVQYFDRLHL
jgi:1-phosphatidylinositol-3-phosphate 5-kinase